MYTSEMPDATIVRASDLEWQKLPAREGIFTKSMTFGDARTRRYLHVQIGRTAPDAMSPRHKHTFDQVRYFIEGEAEFGKTVYQPGDCVYFPEGVSYGPQRGHNGAESLHLVLQFAGPSGTYYPSGDEQRAAKDELERRGVFRDGVYFPADGRPRDGFEALLECITGAAIAYAPARYDAPIRLRASAFAPLPDADDPRIVRRQLARFNERGPEISLIELRAGAVLPVAPADTDRLFTLVAGDARVGDADVPAISCVYVPRGTSSGPIAAFSDSRLLAVALG
jgi:mannose-6-phosphate isomerase-like protein (cupin superfamily)